MRTLIIIIIIIYRSTKKHHIIRLADQQKTIIRNNWFSETEIDEIKRHANSRNVTPERQGTEEEIEDNDGISLQVPPIRTSQSPVHIPQSSPPIQQPSQLNDEQINLINKIKENMTDIPNRLQIPSLKSENKKKLKEIVTKINSAILHITTTNITETNNQTYAAAKTTAEMMGKEIKANVGRTEEEKDKSTTVETPT